MAGQGSRFIKSGYKNPKPFIDVLGKPMILHVLENLNVPDAQFILLIRKDHYLQETKIIQHIEKMYPVKIILIDKLTEGAACTILYAYSLINNDIPLLIANSDQLVDIKINDFVNDSESRKLDGSVLCFKAHETKWSYAKVDNNNLITQIKEKEVISPYATVGIYYFHKGSDFVENAVSMIVHNDRVNNEFYTAPTYNYAIRQGKRYGIYLITTDKMHGIGTPEDLNLYINWKRNVN